MNAMAPRLLILAPHIDDAEFGLGGMIQRRLILEKAAIRVVVISTGSYTRSDGVEVLASRRNEEMHTALQYLGLDDFSAHEGFPENGGLLWDYGKLVSMIEREVRKYEATEVFTCLPSFNQDHRALFDATITAFRPGNLAANLYAYEYPGNCWGGGDPKFGRRYITVLPNHVLRKIEALRLHKSQFDGRKVAVGPEAASILARQRGAEIGVEYAELIYVLKEII